MPYIGVGELWENDYQSTRKGERSLSVRADKRRLYSGADLLTWNGAELELGLERKRLTISVPFVRNGKKDHNLVKICLTEGAFREEKYTWRHSMPSAWE